ncbi:MAG: hypothetical protein IT423_04540 [Pirellulaceae bacterium]|nr:hypothetical protein [Pirellulaceae bacterium]
MRTDVEYTDNLAILMEAKMAVLEPLSELAKQQATITQTGDAEILLSFLARKQPLMDRLAELQSELAIYTHDDPAARVWRSAEHRSACRSASERCQNLLAEIVLLEKQSLDEMSQRRDAMAAQLQDGRDGNLAAQAYQAAGALEASSLDLSSG